MSADNWTVCPACVKDRQDDLNAAEKKLNDDYGKLEAGKWLLELDSFKKMSNTVTVETLREDYSIFLAMSGLFRVRYKAQCTLCGFSFEYTHEQQVSLEEVRP